MSTQDSPTQIEATWTIDDVAVFLRVSVETLRYWRKRRTGPPVARLGKHLRYLPDDVRQWLRQQTAA